MIRELETWRQQREDFERRWDALSVELDGLIARALAAGIKAPTIAKHAGLTRQAVYQRIERSGEDE